MNLFLIRYSKDNNRVLGVRSNGSPLSREDTVDKEEIPERARHIIWRKITLFITHFVRLNKR